MFDETQNLAVKARTTFHRNAGVKVLSDLNPEKMPWADLTKVERAAQAEARKLLDTAQARAAGADEIGKIEAVIDTLGEIATAMADEKDERSAAGTRDPIEDPRRPHLQGRANGAGSDGCDGHTAAFSAWLRAPMSSLTRSDLGRFETRAASSLTGAAGGHVVPELIAGPIMSRARDSNPMRGVVRVLTVGSGDVKFPLSNADATSGWVGETDTRTATTEPTLDAKIPAFGVNYAYVKMTEELANDAIIDVSEWFEREVGMALGEAEMGAIINGDGSKKPKGLLNVAPEAGADGTRTADAFKFLPANSATAFTADELLTMVYDVKARYRNNGRWLMNSATAGMLRKLKTSDGAFLWQESLVAGQPATFSGYPVTIAEAMPDVEASEHPIAFGDFEAAYILATINGMTVTAADQSVTEPGFNKLYVRQRIGGCVYDENACRFLKMAAGS